MPSPVINRIPGGSIPSGEVTLHRCALDCPGQPGYQGWLGHPVPGTGWLGSGHRVTGGSLVLGGLALCLAYLVITGVWPWVPRPSRRKGRWRRAMTVRRDKGRFARDGDLHRVVGVLVLPFLLLWAVTGAGARITLIPGLWFAVMPGQQHPTPQPATGPGAGRDPDLRRAMAAALRDRPNDRITQVILPTSAAGQYQVRTSSGIDPTLRTADPGDRVVQVDPHTGAVVTTVDPTRQPVGEAMWTRWKVPLHSGAVVGPWWRLPWFLLGLSPLFLAVTGASTWLLRRSTRRRRRSVSAAAIQQHGDQPAQHRPHERQDEARVGQH